MNNSAFTLKRAIVLLLIVVMFLSMVSCDKLPFGDIFGDNKEPEQGECQHEMTLDGKCLDCGKIFINTVKDFINFDTVSGSALPDGTVTTELYYVKATVKKIVNRQTGEMVIEDDTGSIKVKALYTEDSESYGNMEEKPDEYDEVFLHCILEKVSGTWQIKTAFIVSFEAVEAPIKTITIAEALELCGEPGNLTTERYYIRGTVKSVTNPAYGAMVIADETGEIPVYNTASKDGTIGYENMEDKPVKGDEVLLYCTLQNHNGTKEIKSAWLIEFTHKNVEIDLNDYTQMTIADARQAEKGELVKVSGVVAQITFANGYKPSGVILVDGTSSIYVYDGDIAGQVEIGNTIEVAAEKAYWILDSEISNAQKFGYNGANQLDNAVLLSNDKGNTAFDKTWIEETTIKEIMDTPATEDITNKIFKVNALVNKVDGNNFVNYYFNDIDGVTGSYTYTQCNGGDFGWLDEFDGKICTVYIVAINAKSSASGCIWRFLPIKVIDDGYTFNTDKAAEYAVKYHGMGQILTKYIADPETQLITSVSSKLLGFENATLSYSSSNDDIVYFYTSEGKTVMHCKDNGTATVTITGSYGGIEYSDVIEVTVLDPEKIDSITVAEAITAAVDSTVTVRGIVGPSVVNKSGFYLFGEDGSVISVLVNDLTQFAGLEIGNEVILTGMRERYVKYDSATYAGQTCIVNAEIIANLYGKNEYSTAKFVTDKTVEELRNTLDQTVDYSTTVFVVEAIVNYVETPYYTSLSLMSTTGSTTITLYCSGADQYSWLVDHAGETVTLELAACNWNDKNFWAFCALSAVTEDGEKIYNTLNFDNN